MSIPPISSGLRAILWGLVATATILLTVFLIFVESNIRFLLRKNLPGEDRRGRVPTNRSPGTWAVIVFCILIIIVGTAIASSAPEKTMDVIGSETSASTTPPYTQTTSTQNIPSDTPDAPPIDLPESPPPQPTATPSPTPTPTRDTESLGYINRIVVLDEYVGANIREEPNTESQILRVLNHATKIEVLDFTPTFDGTRQWLNIRYETDDGEEQDGWVIEANVKAFEILFFDEFIRNINGWDLKSNSHISNKEKVYNVDIFAGDLKMELECKKLGKPAGKNYCDISATVPELVVKNFDLEVISDFESFNYEGNGTGIVIDGEEGGNYSFYILPSGNAVGYRGDQELFNRKYKKISGSVHYGTEHIMRLSFLEDSFALYIDGYLIYENPGRSYYENSTLYFDLFSHDNNSITVTFNDLLITANEDTEFPVDTEQ